MPRTLLATAFLVFVFTLVVAATWAQARRDLTTAWAACTSEEELTRRIVQAHAVEEVDRYVDTVLACIERHQTLLARLWFSREELRAKWERGMRPETRLLIQQINLAREQREQLDALQEDTRAAIDLEAFRRGAHRSADQP
jgi:hypothetical protein